MSILKKSEAIFIDSMEHLTNVMVTDDVCKFTLDYSQMTVKSSDVPKLLSDLMQLYAMVKPALDKKTLEAQDENLRRETPSDERIDLSNIPF